MHVICLFLSSEWSYGRALDHRSEGPTLTSFDRMYRHSRLLYMASHYVRQRRHTHPSIDWQVAVPLKKSHLWLMFYCFFIKKTLSPYLSLAVYSQPDNRRLERQQLRSLGQSKSVASFLILRFNKGPSKLTYASLNIIANLPRTHWRIYIVCQVVIQGGANV